MDERGHMSEQTSQQQTESKRDDMPLTAKWVDARRAEWGAAHVNECIRRSIKGGEADQFYAIENGHVLGTPFSKADPTLADWQDFAILAGVKFAGFMRKPVDGHAYQVQGASSGAD